MTMAAAQAGARAEVNGPEDVLDRAAKAGGPAKGMYGDCGVGSSRRLGSNPDRPCGLLDPCASGGACTGLRGPLVQQCTGGYPVEKAQGPPARPWRPQVRGRTGMGRLPGNSC